MKLLRKIDSRIDNLEHFSEVLVNQGYTVSWSNFDYMDSAINLQSDDQQWSVWFDVAYLAYVISPSLSDVYITKKIAELITNIIIGNKDVLVGDDFLIPIHEMDLRIDQNNLASKECRVLKVTKNDQILFLEKSPPIIDKVKFDIRKFYSINCVVEINIGHVVLLVSHLSSIQKGDVLVVSKSQPSMYINNVKIIKLQLIGDYIMLNVDESTLTEQDIELSEIKELTELPVKVDIVILNKVLPISEVHEILNAKLIELPQGAHRNIILKINNQEIAKGELVELDDRLAVEITSCHLGGR